MIVESEINVKNVDRFYKSLKSEIESGSEITLDFAGTARIDSSAAQVIISAIKKCEETNKKISIIGVSPELKKLLKLAGLEI